MRARDIMTSEVEVVTQDDSLSRAAKLMRDSDVGSLPVVDDRQAMNIIGMITDRDIAVRHVAEDHPAECVVGDHMTSGRIHSVQPDSDIEDVMRTMKSEQVRRVVVAEGDRIVGIISQADLATSDGIEEETGEVVGRISEPKRR